MRRTIIPTAYVRMAAAARRNRGSAAAACLEDLGSAVKTIISATRTLSVSAGERVATIQERHGVNADMIEILRIRSLGLEAIIKRLVRIEFLEDGPHDDAEIPA